VVSSIFDVAFRAMFERPSDEPRFGDPYELTAIELPNLGARRERTCFHSFRHCFRDELRNARINHDLAMALGGWTHAASAQSKVSENYGSGHRVEVLAEAISHLTFRDIDLSHIKG